MSLIYKPINKGANYKVVKGFRFRSIIEVGAIFEQSENDTYIDEYNDDLLPAAFVENNPEYFELVKDKKEKPYSNADYIEQLESYMHEGNLILAKLKENIKNQ